MLKKIDKKARNLQRIYGLFIHKYGIKGIKICKQLRDPNDSNPISLPGIKHPIRIRKNVFTDYWMVRGIFAREDYNIEMETPQNIIDLGANIGMFSVYMKNRFPDAKIVFVETDSGNFELAEENLKSYPDMTGILAGVWYKNAKLKIVNPDADQVSFIVEEDPEGDIDAISIPTIMEKHSMDRIDVLKIDIEGTEKILFEKDYESWLKRTKYLIVETHDRFLENCSKTLFEAVNKTFTEYRLSLSKENLVIENMDLD